MTDRIKQTITASVEVAGALGTVIFRATKNSSLKGIPAGHLYAQVMGSMPLDMFEQFIGMLTDTGLVRREPSHLLVWIGPDLDKPLPSEKEVQS